MDTQNHQSISLCSRWELCWCDAGTKRYEDADAMFAGAVTCPVPGDVHMALTDAGIIRDPLLDLNSRDCRWLETQEFWYRKKFHVAEEFMQDCTELVFEGLDLTADIWLNGQHIGSHNNAFIEKVIDVSGCIRAGENTLVVRIDDGVHSVKDKPVDFMARSWNNDQPYRAWMRKPQFVYGWDWTIWLPTCGIWKPVTLRSWRKGCMDDVNVTSTLDGAITVSADVRVLASGKYTLICEVSGDSRFEQKEPVSVRQDVFAEIAGTVSAELKLQIDHPRPWWPNGAGDPYLYTVKVSLLDEGGSPLQSSQLRHGIRTVQISQEPLEGEHKSFTFEINGLKIFAKGANHVPCDCLPGRITDEKNRALLEAAADMHMNMIRVWGGGIYESEGFMECCDELGLMVWHDFMFACAYYPDHDPEFRQEIHREATAAIKRLRRHSSLVGWSGNNEIQEMYHAATSYGNPMPWYGGYLYETLLPGLVETLCPDRIYRQSSPFGGSEPAGYEMGDQHTWHFTHRPGWEHYLDLWRFTDFDFKFLSEFGIIGAMNLESARKCIREDALCPDSEEWLHHTNTSSDHQLVDVFVKKYFGAAPRDMQEYILKSQVIQAEIMRHIYDELRSRKFRCSGILLWTLSDSYGIHNWSVIDYYLSKRPVYYYLKRSMAPVNVSFMGYEVQTFDGMANYREHYAQDPAPVQILITSDAMEERTVTLTYKIETFDGCVLKSGSRANVLKANSVTHAADVTISGISFAPEKTILYAAVWADGELLGENRYFFAPYKDLALEKAKIAWCVTPLGEESAELTLTADTFVWMLHLSDCEGIIFSDNDFDLLPGEEKRITVTGKDAHRFVPKLHSLNPTE